MPKIRRKNLENTLNLAKIDLENLENKLKHLVGTLILLIQYRKLKSLESEISLLQETTTTMSN